MHLLCRQPMYLIKNNVLAVKVVFSKEPRVVFSQREVSAPYAGELHVILVAQLITPTCHHVKQQELINFYQMMPFSLESVGFVSTLPVCDRLEDDGNTDQAMTMSPFTTRASVPQWATEIQVELTYPWFFESANLAQAGSPGHPLSQV